MMLLYSFKGYLPGLFGTSHGALQFMAYEELKRDYTKYKNMAPEQKLVSQQFLRLMFPMPGPMAVYPICLPKCDIYIYIYIYNPCNHVYPFFTEPSGIHHNGSPIQNICCGDDVPLPGGPGTTAGPAQQIHGRHRCHQKDVEVQRDLIHRSCIEFKLLIYGLNQF